MQTNNAQQATFVAYPQMVTNLFKTMPTDALTLLHATVGMAGETAELLELYRDQIRSVSLAALAGETLDKVVKELGDWRFYAQAVWNIYGWEWDSFVLPLPGGSGGLQFAIENMVIHSGAILDVSKKAWAYESEADARVLYEQMEHALAGYADALFYVGISDDAVCDANQEKLGKRFPNGVYSNADALARADKADEFQPGNKLPVDDKVHTIG